MAPGWDWAPTSLQGNGTPATEAPEALRPPPVASDDLAGDSHRLLTGKSAEGTVGYVDTNFQVAMQALLLLALAVLFTGIVAELSGRMVRVLPVALFAALPVGLSPRRRRLMSAAYLITGLGPQLWLAAMIVAPPDGLRDNARALLAMELAVVAVWLAYLVRLPRVSTARWADWRLPASEAPPAEGYRAREFAPRVGWAVWVAVGAALLAVVVWAWPQLSGDPEVAGRGLVPAFVMGLTLVYAGVRLRGKRPGPRRG